MGEFFVERFLRLLVLLGEIVFCEPQTSNCCCCPIPDVWIRARFGGIEFIFKLGDEIYMSFTVPADHQDEPFTLDAITGAQDSEGNEIPASEFTIEEPTSSAQDVVSIVDDPANPGGKAFHFGIPGAALVQANVLHNGTPVGSPLTATFTVPAGAPVNIQGGGFNIPGLTPDPV